MKDYTSQDIAQLQRQYDMLVKSVIFSDFSEKQDIYHELNRIEKCILEKTEILYNKKYQELFNKKTSLLNEEKDKLVSLIELIENRRRYVSDEINKHKRNVNASFEIPDVLGEDKIAEFQKRIRIIDKYSQNIKLKDKLTKELDDIKDKLNKSESKIRTNERINKELESKMIDMLEKSFKAMEIYSYKDREEEIDLAFKELSFAREKAKENVDNAKHSANSSLIVECEKMYDSVEEEYRKYYEKKMLLNLLYIYDRVVNNYEELFNKRRDINDILSQIDSSDFYKLVFNEINKQYTTIKLEQQDIRTYKSLKEEKDKKERLLNHIEKENSCEEFSIVLNELLKNEKIKHEKEEQERRKVEYEERQKKLIEDSKKQDEFRKKQKVIEEARKREIEIRTRELLEKQKTGFIPKVEVKKEKPVISQKTSEEERVKKEIPKSNNIKEKVEKKVEVPNFFPVKEDSITSSREIKNDIEESKTNKEEIIKNENKEEKINKSSSYDSIMQEPDDKNEFSIPVIKNDKLVAKKVKEEKASENDVDEFMRKFLENSKKEEVNEVNDMFFPEMPN